MRNGSMKGLAFQPLTPERLGDLDTVFGERGCSVARNCWCMYYRKTGRDAPPEGVPLREANRLAMQKLVRGGTVPGLIGYRDGEPVGWVSFGPREEYRRLENSRLMAAVDAKPVWSIICFVVPSRHRGQGVARALLRAAIAHAKRAGATLLEAYPVDPKRTDADAYWFGTRSMYDAEGFVEVARRSPGRPVMRKALRPARR
jgi:GNAT superfamily N-acetyltransferase